MVNLPWVPRVQLVLGLRLFHVLPMDHNDKDLLTYFQEERVIKTILTVDPLAPELPGGPGIPADPYNNNNNKNTVLNIKLSLA